MNGKLILGLTRLIGGLELLHRQHPQITGKTRGNPVHLLEFELSVDT